MTRPVGVVWLVFALGLGCAPSHPVDPGINAVVGDRSWIETHGEPPPSEALEDDRIATHLQWVEGELRAAASDHLSGVRARRRAELLDVLHAYTEARRFPRHDGGGDGRQPRFVDSEGRHCAVAHLVRSSVGTELVAIVQRDHELDFVADMNMPELADWASSHGFTVDELALIQPMYDYGGVYQPTPEEEQAEQERRRMLARVPRPLTREHVARVVETYAQRQVVQACVAEMTGHWTVKTTVRVGRGSSVRAIVEVRDLETGVRQPALERCFRREARSAMAMLLRSANYRYVRALRVVADRRVDVATPAEIEAAILARRRPWHVDGSRTEATAECLREASSDAPLTVMLRVSGWNGEVSIRWADMDVDPRQLPPEERSRWYCLQGVLGYARLPEHGVRDHDLTIEILPNGDLRPVPDSE